MDSALAAQLSFTIETFRNTGSLRGLPRMGASIYDIRKIFLGIAAKKRSSYLKKWPNFGCFLGIAAKKRSSYLKKWPIRLLNETTG